MIAFAKSVTSGYLPLGGVILKESLYQTLLDAGTDFALHHGFTYSGHPTVCAAGLANLDIIAREGLIARVRKLAPHFKRRLGALAHHAIVGDVRSVGLMAAVELVRDKTSKESLPAEWNVPARIRAAALARGVIIRASVDTIVVCPPLVITAQEIDLLASTIDAAIGEVSKALEA